MEVLSLKVLAQEADTLTSAGQGQQLARVIQAQVEKLSHQQSPEETVCLSFTGIKIATVSFLTSLIVPLIEFNLANKTVNKIYFGDVNDEIALEVEAVIALHRQKHKGTVREFTMVILKNNKPKVLGYMGKSIRKTLSFLDDHLDAFLDASSVAEHCSRSVSSVRNHLNQLVKLGVLFRQRMRGKMVYWFAFQIPERSLFTYDLGLQEYDETDPFDPMTDPSYDDFHEAMHNLPMFRESS